MTERFTTIEQASDFLLRYSPEKQAGETYTLTRMKDLMNRLGNPQNGVLAVHVAGTSGKTSTAFYIRSLLRAHGVRTGLTMSPHISSITERVQIDDGPLSDEVFIKYLNEFIDKIEQFNDLQPTYFELLTAFAYWTFHMEGVDYMVIEVGLGGLHDATNVIDSANKVSVITPIGLDHTEVLGRTLPLIAAQKAGIISPSSVVFTVQQEASVLSTLRQTVDRQGARLYVVNTSHRERSTVPLFQQDNFSLARRVIEYITRRDRLAGIPANKEDELAEQTPPGRFERYNVGDKTIILDGAHNPQKVEALLESLKVRHNGPFAWLTGFISAPDEKISQCVGLLANQTDQFIATQFSVGQGFKSRQSVEAVWLAQEFRRRGASVVAKTDPQDALDLLLQSKQRTIIVTGSLYLVASLRERVRNLAT